MRVNERRREERGEERRVNERRREERREEGRAVLPWSDAHEESKVSFVCCYDQCAHFIEALPGYLQVQLGELSLCVFHHEQHHLSELQCVHSAHQGQLRHLRDNGNVEILNEWREIWKEGGKYGRTE